MGCVNFKAGQNALQNRKMRMEPRHRLSYRHHKRDGTGESFQTLTVSYMFQDRNAANIHLCPRIDVFRFNTVHTNLHFNIVLPSSPWFSKWPLSLRSPHQNPACTSPPSYVLHALPTSLFSILSPEQYFVKSTDHEASQHAVFSSPLLPRTSQTQNLLLEHSPSKYMSIICSHPTIRINISKSKSV